MKHEARNPTKEQIDNAIDKSIEENFNVLKKLEESSTS